MRRTHFLIGSLVLLASSTAIGAESQLNASQAAAAEPAVTPPAVVATPASEASTPAAGEAAATAQAAHKSRSIVLGPQGVDDQGRVGRLHTVSRGDTLWDVSAAYLGTPWVWPSVWTDNDDIANPHLIHPGDRIWITANEMRVVSDDEADAFLERLLEQPAAPEGETAAETEAVAPPAAEEMMEASEPVLAAVPEPMQTGRQITVSTRAAMGFVTAEQMAGASSIVESPSERTFMTAGDVVYLGLGEGDTQVGDRFTIFEAV